MTPDLQLILASASPRRKDLLQSVGLDPLVQPQDVDETPFEQEAPLAYALRIATLKAEACARENHQIILAADTVVAFDGQNLGKPKDDEDAKRMLRALSGKTHVVHTAVVVRGASRFSDVVSTQVRFRVLTESQIDLYVRGGDGRDKAGSYGIQSGGGTLVAHVVGSYTNVVGLPLEESLSLLRLIGIEND